MDDVTYAVHLQVFANVDLEELEDEANFYSLMFLVIGAGAAIAMYLQVCVCHKNLQTW